MRQESSCRFRVVETMRLILNRSISWMTCRHSRFASMNLWKPLTQVARLSRAPTLGLGFVFLIASGCATNSAKQRAFSSAADHNQDVPAVELQDETPFQTATHSEAFDTQVQELSSSFSERLQPIGQEGPSISLVDLEQLALSHNPAIGQATTALARAEGIRTQVGLKPNPTVGYFGEEIGNEGAGGLHGGFISQTFVRGEKLRWNRHVIDCDVSAVKSQIEVQRQRVLTDLRVAFYGALAIQERLRLARDFRKVAYHGVEFSEQRLKAKVGTRPDVLQSEIQHNEVELTIQQTEVELSAALTEIAALAGVDYLGVSKLSGQLDAELEKRDLETEYARITASSPLLAAAQARVNRARASIQRQDVQAVPNVTALLGAGADDASGNAFANVQLSMPIPVHNKNEGNIQAAHAEYGAAVQNVERIRRSIRRDLARTMAEYTMAELTVRQYRDLILPKSEETLQLVQKARAAGEFDFLRVLTARRAYFDAKLKYVTAQGRLAQAAAKVDGLLLTGGLSNVLTYTQRDTLRRQALNGQ